MPEFKDPEMIVALYTERAAAFALPIAQMARVRDQYNGDLIVPLPELDRNEEPAVANLLAVGLDAVAQRVGSTIPDINFPALALGKKGADDRARKRKQAMTGIWAKNKMQLMLYRRSRHHFGYGTTPVVIRPDTRLGCPKWFIRDPLATFPADSADPDEIHPADCIFSMKRQRSWVRRNYPKQYQRIAKPAVTDERDTDWFQILEYVDGNELTLLLVGASDTDSHFHLPSGGRGTAGTKAEVLERTINPTGMSPATVPHRITLDRVQSDYAGTMGMYAWRAKLMALSTIATQKGVFPETWAVPHPNSRQVRIIREANSITGDTGILEGGTLQVIHPDPSFMVNPMMANIEREERTEGATSPEFSGEPATNTRTARRARELVGAAVDFKIKEAQEIFAAGLEIEDRIAIAQDKAFFGNVQKSWVFSFQGVRDSELTYTPNETWETDQHHVSYAFAGADINNVGIAGLQRVGAGSMSLQEFREIDPLSPDPERSKDLVTSERIEALAFATMEQAPPQLEDLGRMAQLVRQNKLEFIDALIQQQEEAQERQNELEAGTPGAQPGMNAAPDPGGAIPEELGTIGNVNQQLLALRGPQFQSRTEQAS